MRICACLVDVTGTHKAILCMGLRKSWREGSTQRDVAASILSAHAGFQASQAGLAAFSEHNWDFCFLRQSEDFPKLWLVAFFQAAYLHSYAWSKIWIHNAAFALIFAPSHAFRRKKTPENTVWAQSAKFLWQVACEANLLKVLCGADPSLLVRTQTALQRFHQGMLLHNRLLQARFARVRPTRCDKMLSK